MKKSSIESSVLFVAVFVLCVFLANLGCFVTYGFYEAIKGFFGWSYVEASFIIGTVTGILAFVVAMIKGLSK